MGFDLHGLKPAIPEPVWTGLEEFVEVSKGQFQLNPKIDKIEYSAHCEAHEQWANEVKGAYFRNNIWHWRPLWELVCNICNDILTKEDIIAGSYNDGHNITEETAIKMADKLKQYLDSDFITQYIKDRNKEIQNKKLVDCKICDTSGWRKRSSTLGRGETVLLKEWAYNQELNLEDIKKENIPQAIDCIPCNSCNGSGKRKDNSTRYYLDLDNVKHFTEFCKHSGGFSIC